VVIPPAVYREVVESGADYPVAKVVEGALGNWVSVAEAPGPALVATLRSAFHLDLGESEAILVAEALGNAPVLMDERRGVRCARSRGLVLIRTPLIYADAKILGLIGSVQEKLDELRSHGFRLSTGHYEQILKDLGDLLPLSRFHFFAAHRMTLASALLSLRRHLTPELGRGIHPAHLHAGRGPERFQLDGRASRLQGGMRASVARDGELTAAERATKARAHECLTRR
jgi:predicted nucleic acid-binding protein